MIITSISHLINLARPFRRSNVIWPLEADEIPAELAGLSPSHPPQPPPTVKRCIACNTLHREGYCPLKIAGPERCNLCGLAHYGVARTCPHIRSETQVRAMLEALKQSGEPRHLVQLATRYLQGVKGTLAQQKRINAEKAAERAAAAEAARRGFAGAAGGGGVAGEGTASGEVQMMGRWRGADEGARGGAQMQVGAVRPSSFDQGFSHLAGRVAGSM